MSQVSETQGEHYALEGAQVYLHVTYDGPNRIIHLDVDHPDLNDIVHPKESTYVGGREGGIYVGFRPQQQERAEEYLRDRVPDSTRVA